MLHIIEIFIRKLFINHTFSIPPVMIDLLYMRLLIDLKLVLIILQYGTYISFSLSNNCVTCRAKRISSHKLILIFALLHCVNPVYYCEKAVVRKKSEGVSDMDDNMTWFRLDIFPAVVLLTEDLELPLLTK